MVSHDRRADPNGDAQRDREWHGAVPIANQGEGLFKTDRGRLTPTERLLPFIGRLLQVRLPDFTGELARTLDRPDARIPTLLAIGSNREIIRHGSREATVLSFALTHAGVPVEGAGLRLHVTHGHEPRLTTALYTAPPDLSDVDLETDVDLSEGALDRLATILADLIGRPRDAIRLVDRGYTILAVDRFRARGSSSAAMLGIRVDVGGRDHDGGWAEYVAYIDRRAERVIALLSQTGYATDPGDLHVTKARVLAIDPVSHYPSGSFRFGPKAPPTRLADAPTETVSLELCRVPGSMKRELRGRLVGVRADPTLGIMPPTEPPSFANRNIRTDAFAAINAYYHCDKMFRLVEAFGFDLQSVFNLSRRPVDCQDDPTVIAIHRASIRPGGRDGLCINAKMVPFRTPIGPKAGTIDHFEFYFALADLAINPKLFPLGVATDGRVAWHEFAHALLYGATGELHMRFAHSPGDALAAVLSDPDSRFGDVDDADDAHWRGITYPWVTAPNRNHMREIEQGWRWSGGLYDPDSYPDIRDPLGYQGEQLLSSTLFWLYRAIGGDAYGRTAADRGTRRFAAHQTAYLIMRAIQILGRARYHPARYPWTFAFALMDADIGTPDFAHGRRSRAGGAIWKVVHWAFEKQGLIADESVMGVPSSVTWPLSVDLYIDDGRKGAYDPTKRAEDWHALDSSIWLGASASDPARIRRIKRNADNHIYVRLHNKGTRPATGITVALYESRTPNPRWGTDDLSRIGSVVVPDALPPMSQQSSGIVVGPIIWRPVAPGPHHLLAVADAQEDPSNLNAALGLPCAASPMPIDDLVPFDNNLGFRKLP